MTVHLWLWSFLDGFRRIVGRAVPCANSTHNTRTLAQIREGEHWLPSGPLPLLSAVYVQNLRWCVSVSEVSEA